MNKSRVVGAVICGALLALAAYERDPTALPESAAVCAKMNFDPLIAADGIAPADDPVLLFRSPTYGSAFSEILTTALAPVHAASVAGR